MDQQHLEVSRLPSGLTVITAAQPAARSLALGLYVGVGAAHEAPGEAGWSHLLEHLHLSGDSRAPRTLARLDTIASHGGVYNADTALEYTAYSLQVPRRYWRAVAGRFRSALRSPALSPAAIAGERAVVAREAAEALSMPTAGVHAALLSAAFAGTPFARSWRDIAGGPTGPADADTAGLAAFRARGYTAGNAWLVAAGAIGHAEACDWAGSLDLPAGERRLPPAGAWTPGPALSHLRSGGTPQAVVFVAWPTVPSGDPRSTALGLATLFLAGGPTSHLADALRRRRGLTYDVSGIHRQYAGAGAVEIHAETSPDQGERLTALILDGVATGWRALDETRLRRIKRQAIAHHELLADDARALVATLGDHFATQARVLGPDEVAARIEAVTLEELRATWEGLLVPERAVVARLN